ncbi:Condensation domain-containing protein [Acetitomaculum ruminis DSM 5522]|uniref:Condensation domain-containing protein n=1 Tax=Acetitomaculum ruminis DSM 5522 TaxID=1120918 RepID=A0A1I0XAA4_9FIRM|nr:condensation domain-containing protein [Acetitomaculum ruminis]SFA97366.1 Condensation domain-containing protein [Acetitomaculum ruminis DSM 5522]
MTRLQCAYQLAESMDFDLCGIECSVYIEFKTRNLDYDRLNNAWKEVYKRHPALRGRIVEDGYIEYVDFNGFEDIILINKNDDAKKICQEMIKRENSNMAVLLAYKEARKVKKMYFSMNIILADPLSFQIILEDLSNYYIKGKFETEINDEKINEYFDIVWKTSRQEKKKDRQYWKEKITDYGICYKIPACFRKNYTKEYESHKAYLDKESYASLLKCSKKYGVSLEMVLLSIFALAVKEEVKEEKIVINYPLFEREKSYEDCVGDFSKNLLAGLDLRNLTSFKSLVLKVFNQIKEYKSHLSLDGLEVMTLYNSYLLDDNYKEALVFSPSIKKDLISKDFLEQIGDIVEISSKTPDVALDAQTYKIKDTLFFIWVVPKNWFNKGQIEKMFKKYMSLCEKYANENQWEKGEDFKAKELKGELA